MIRLNVQLKSDIVFVSPWIMLQHTMECANRSQTCLIWPKGWMRLMFLSTMIWWLNHTTAIKTEDAADVLLEIWLSSIWHLSPTVHFLLSRCGARGSGGMSWPRLSHYKLFTSQLILLNVLNCYALWPCDSRADSRLCWLKSFSVSLLSCDGVQICCLICSSLTGVH